MSAFRSVCLLVLLLGAPAASVAQTASVPLRGPAPSMLFGANTVGPLQTGWAVDSVRPSSQTYLKEGAIVGGVLGAVAGGLLAEVACGLSEDPNKSCTGIFLLGGIFGAPFGALPGALIGGLFPKHPRSEKRVRR